ncbi:hypothetical protein FPOAC1_004395 [Fusarium poae]|uniref:hypothetical protein n=1 Tax=Fusarium poae TaxID=36050 RepID=UPI001CE8A579|nr:hypothetical protein FPOAC1_004395 [Fusarium poae]KAG8671156.1 hypothetical protein FPOAC1_004395 [Fusarium poae]
MLRPQLVLDQRASKRNGNMWRGNLPPVGSAMAPLNVFVHFWTIGWTYCNFRWKSMQASLEGDLLRAALADSDMSDLSP